MFAAIAGGIGAVPDASLPYATLAAVTAAFLALVNLVAAEAARRARRPAPATVLAAE